MNSFFQYVPLIAFICFTAAICAVLWSLLSGSLKEIGIALKDHAKTYSIAYVKGGGLIALAMLASFDENFRTLTKETAVQLPWWGWTLLFFKPISAGLAVLVAFLDRSAARATENKNQNP